MKKSKLSLLAFILPALFVSGCTSPQQSGNSQNDPKDGGEGTRTINPSGSETTTPSSSGESSPSGEATSTPSESSTLTEIERVVKIVVDDLSLDNITYDTYTEAVVSGQTIQSTSSTLEIDGNKYHTVADTQQGSSNYHSESYYEKGEEKNYIYRQSGDVWVKEEDPYGVPIGAKDTITGLSQVLLELEDSYIIDDDGYYYAENIEVHLTPELIIKQFGHVFDGYTYTQEEVVSNYKYLKIGIDGEHLSLFECLVVPITMHVDEELKTVTFLTSENETSFCRVNNFRDIGTTVVSLPVVS